VWFYFVGDIARERERCTPCFIKASEVERRVPKLSWEWGANLSQERGRKSLANLFVSWDLGAKFLTREGRRRRRRRVWQILSWEWGPNFLQERGERVTILGWQQGRILLQERGEEVAKFGLRGRDLCERERERTAGITTERKCTRTCYTRGFFCTNPLS